MLTFNIVSRQCIGLKLGPPFEGQTFSLLSHMTPPTVDIHLGEGNLPHRNHTVNR